jgi:hypothetical protein
MFPFEEKSPNNPRSKGFKMWLSHRVLIGHPRAAGQKFNMHTIHRARFPKRWDHHQIAKWILSVFNVRLMPNFTHSQIQEDNGPHSLFERNGRVFQISDAQWTYHGLSYLGLLSRDDGLLWRHSSHSYKFYDNSILLSFSLLISPLLKSRQRHTTSL